jgi:hypothetical protein
VDVTRHDVTDKPTLLPERSTRWPSRNHATLAGKEPSLKAPQQSTTDVNRGAAFKIALRFSYDG